MLLVLEERTDEREVVTWLKQDIKDTEGGGDEDGGGGDDRVALLAVSAAVVAFAKLPIKSSKHQPA